MGFDALTSDDTLWKLLQFQQIFCYSMRHFLVFSFYNCHLIVAMFSTCFYVRIEWEEIINFNKHQCRNVLVVYKNSFDGLIYLLICKNLPSYSSKILLWFLQVFKTSYFSGLIFTCDILANYEYLSNALSLSLNKTFVPT